jgi:hypothetical protein
MHKYIIFMHTNPHRTHVHTRTQMDTVGNAFVVMGLCDGEDALKSLGRKMVFLAKEMIVAWDEFSLPLHAEVRTH